MASIAEMRMDTKLIADLCTRKCVEAEMECIERFQKHLKEKKLTKKEREELEEMIVERNQSINKMIKSDLHKQVSAAAEKHIGDVWFDRQYPDASCLRCETKLNSKTVVMCGGGGDCETWYCSTCHAEGTHDCDVCKVMNALPDAVPFTKPKKMIIIKLSKEENTKRKHRIEDDEPLNLVAERIRATKAEAFVDDWYKKGCPLKFDKEAMLKKIMLMRK